MCTTTSFNTAIYNNTVSTTSSLYAFSGINSYAEAYFDAISEPDAITISFTTPFIYLPTPVPSRNDTRVWGYVPPALIKWAAENPDYVAKYPALSSCLPGGPSILPGTDPWARLHLVVVPQIQIAENYLTVSATAIINSLQCLRPGFCPESATAPNLRTPVATASPTSTGPIDTEERTPSQLPIQSPPISLELSGPTRPVFSASLSIQAGPEVPKVFTGTTGVGAIMASAFGLVTVSTRDSPSTTLKGSAQAVAATDIVIDGTTTVPAARATGYVTDGQTLVPGSPAITISGKVISLDSLATAVVIDGSTIPGAYPTVAQPALVITVGTQLVTADSASRYVIGGQTLTPGESAITKSGTVISIVPLPSGTSGGAPTTAPSASFPLQTFNSGGSGNSVCGLWVLQLSLLCLLWIEM